LTDESGARKGPLDPTRPPTAPFFIIVPDGRRDHLGLEKASGDDPSPPSWRSTRAGQGAPLAQDTIGFVSRREPPP
jgi:hypothetical protein